MNNFNKYPLYNDSEIEWLEKIPSHWDVIKVKHIFKERVEKGFPDKPLLAATQSGGVIKKEDYETNTVTAQKDFHLLKLVKHGDFVISLRSFQGGIEISHEEGIISPAYTIMKPNEELDKNYFKHLLKSKYFIDGLTTFVTGIREGQNIDYSKFRRSYIISPPLPEQTAIANFLDKKTAEIKEFIALKERTIELLKERKMAIINHAVTKGLDPTVEMKDSGIEWLGEIPKHWEVKKLKHIARLKSGETISPDEFTKEGYPVYGGNGFRGFTQCYTNEGEFALIGRQGALCGNVNYVEGKFYASEHAIVTYPKKNQNVKWLGELMKIADFNRFSQSAAQPGIAVGVIKEVVFVEPPIHEQNKIADLINALSNQIALLITQTEKEISLIKEYQQSLISEVSTGKVDVTKR